MALGRLMKCKDNFRFEAGLIVSFFVQSNHIFDVIEFHGIW